MDNQCGDQLRPMAKLRTRSSSNVNDDLGPLPEEAIETNTLMSDSIKNVSGFAQNLDMRIKKLKRSLEGWREIVLALNSVLLWEKQWHPGAIFGAFTTAFLFLWAVDPSFLTTMSVLGLVIAIGDYLVPTLTLGFCRNDTWTGAKEKKFDDICRTLVLYYTHVSTMLASFYLMRTVRPKMYYSILVGALLLLAWLGSTMNNLLLTYLTVLMFCMSPGLERKGVMCKYSQIVTAKVKDILKLQKVQGNIKSE